MLCTVELEGEELWLLADKAVYWPARQCLMIADAHFGKASAYRSLGQPVPQGTTTENLQRLDRLLSALPCTQVIFLGDFLHGGLARQRHAGRIEKLASLNPDLPMTLIRGNHDKRAGDPPEDLNINVVTEPLLMGPLPCSTNLTPIPATTCWRGMCIRCIDYAARVGRAYVCRAL